MTQGPYGGPERRHSTFISMDAAMLARQSEKIDELIQHIDRLSEAIDTRPTREELRRRHKREAIRRWLLIGTAVITFAFLGYQQNEINDLLEDDRQETFTVCEDRNRENAQFLNLLTRVTEISDGPGRSELERIFAEYAKNLEPVDCTTLLKKE